MKTTDYTPESQLLYYYCEGIPRHDVISSVDIENIREDLRNRKIRLYFPFYWSHGDVRLLKKLLHEQVDPKDILYVADSISHLVLSRDESCVHWIERINLFHLYGLIRIYGASIYDEALNWIERIIKESTPSRGNALLLISAANSKAVLENRDPKDETDFFSIASAEPRVILDFGMYQIFYHGGIVPCIQELESDIKDNQKVPIPGSVLSLLVSCDVHFKHGDPKIKDRIYDQLYSRLPEKSKQAIDRAYCGMSQYLTE